MLKIFIPAVLAMAAAAPATAATLFSDNFDSATPLLTVTTLPGWTVTGNVDLVPAVNGYSIENCNVVCVDLDGTTGPGQLLSDPVAFGSGKQVLISFTVSGNQRDAADDEFFFELLFGNPLTYNNNILSGFAYGSTGIFTNASSGTYSEVISAGRPFLTYTYGFIPTVAGTLQLRLGTTSGDNIGPILDNVLVTQVPEPATWAMLITGFGLVGFAARRRRILAA